MDDSHLLDRYVSMLEVEPGQPSIDHLRQLVRAQLQRVPFENISKLWRYKKTGLESMVSLEEHLNGIENHRFGGTCYANNWYFGRLLAHQGFGVAFCGADMSKPDVHTVLIVSLEDQEYLVDVGYAAPFFEPIRRDLEQPIKIPWGDSHYVFHPTDRLGRTRLELYRADKQIHGYLARALPRSLDHFRDIIADSFRPDANFMTALVAERFFDIGSVRIHNFSLTEASPGGHETTVFSDREQVIQTVEDHIGIKADIVREAIADIPLKADIYS